MSPQYAVGHVNYLGARLRLSAFIRRPEEEEEEEGPLSLRIPRCPLRGGGFVVGEGWPQSDGLPL